MRNLLALIFSLVLFTPLLGQELNCNVVVNVGPAVETTERRIFQDMETAFYQFLNNTEWTSDVFKNQERINCNLVITIEKMPAVGNFTASVQVQASRPIYGTDYESIILNFADRDWQFQYNESQPLQYNDNAFTNNITSILAFYVYVILGFDYDSFSNLGGTEYFENARQVVNNAQQSNRKGWSQFEGNTRNRFWLAENLNNQQLTPVREAIYTYHRKGLDVFSQDKDQGRQEILTSLKRLEQANQRKPNSILIITFFDAKKDEMINIFSEGNIQVRREAFNILSQLDPSNTDEYEVIISN
ncbi:MAG: DUF4835 family protein [Cyclobacteriaceae bacterium]